MNRAVLLASFVLLCCARRDNGGSLDVVATVNGESLGRRNFEEQLTRDVRDLESAARTREAVEQYARSLLETLITRMVLLQAAHEAKLTVSDEEVDRRMLALSADYSAVGFDEALEKGGVTREALAKETREELLIEKLFEKNHPREATEAASVDAGPAESAENDLVEEVRTLHIVVKTADEAKRIQRMLGEGKRFSDVARRYSISPDARVGGDLGFFRRGQMPKAFEEAVFALRVGATSGVVATDYGFHLFHLLERRSVRRGLAPEARERDQREEQRRAQQAQLVNRLRAAAQVRINEKALAFVVTHHASAP